MDLDIDTTIDFDFIEEHTPSEFALEAIRDEILDEFDFFDED